jgi:succinoglycan biosynthesis transport protein ExoP
MPVIDTPQAVDLSTMVTILGRYAKRIVLGSAIGCAALAATLLSLPNRYTAEAVISGEGGGGPGPLQDFDGIRIETRAMAGPGTDSVATVMQSDGFLSRLLAAVGQQQVLQGHDGGQLTTWISQIQAWMGTSQPPDQVREQTRAFKTLKANLAVIGDEKSPVLRIRYTDEDPVLAATVVNAAAKQLLDDRQATHERQLAGTIASLKAQIEKVHTQISAATEQASGLRSNLQYFATPSGTILAQQITDATQAVSDAAIAVSTASTQYSAASASAGPRRDNRALNNLVDSPTLQRLVTEETSLQHDDAELASSFGERYPERLEIKSRLANVGAAIQREIARQLAALREKVTQAQRHQEALQERLNALRAKTAEAGRADLAIQMNERQIDGLLHSQNSLIRLLQQLEFGSAGADRLYVAAWGVPPLIPSQPHRLLVFAIGSVVVIGLAVTSAIAYAVATRKCMTVAAVRAAALAREIFTLPVIGRSRRRHLLEQRKGNRLLDRVLMRRIRDIALWMTTEKGTGPITVAVSSLHPGEGKTTLSLLLAYGFASMGRRTLVLDCDHCSNGATRRLAPLAESPSAPTVSGDSPHESTMIRATHCEGLSYATANKQLCRMAFAGDTVELRRCLDTLHEEFAVIVLDMPPVAPVTEAINLTPLSTFHVLVTDWKSASFDRLARVRALFERYHSTIDLIVFNRCPDDREARRALRRSGYDPEDHILRAA